MVSYRQAAYSPENAMLWRPTVKFLAGEDTGENKKNQHPNRLGIIRN